MLWQNDLQGLIRSIGTERNADCPCGRNPVKTLSINNKWAKFRGLKRGMRFRIETDTNAFKNEFIESIIF
jgi:hypothetical protein